MLVIPPSFLAVLGDVLRLFLVDVRELVARPCLGVEQLVELGACQLNVSRSRKNQDAPDKATMKNASGCAVCTPI